MTTTYTQRVAVLAETGSGPQNRLNVEPEGDHLLWPPDAPPDYRDADGVEYRYAEASWTPKVARKLRGIENAPQVSVTTTGEVVSVSEIAGREVIWNDGARAMVRTKMRAEIVEGLERIDHGETL